MHSSDFHAHHSPQGAYATFTCGRFAVGGGPTIEGTRPASMDLIIGYADRGTEDVHALPFFRGAGSADISEFAADAATPPKNRRLLLADLERSYQRSVDSWTVGDFSFANLYARHAAARSRCSGRSRLGRRATAGRVCPSHPEKFQPRSATSAVRDHDRPPMSIGH